MGKTTDLFQKIRYTKGTFYARMSTIKYGPNRSRRFKKDGKNTQKNCTKKIFTIQIITMV